MATTRRTCLGDVRTSEPAHFLAFDLSHGDSRYIRTYPAATAAVLEQVAIL